MNERLSIRLQPSRVLAWLLAVPYAIAAVALWLTPVAAIWSALGTLVLAGALVRAVRLHAWQSAAASVVALDLREDCSVAAYTRAGASHEYQVVGSTFVSPFLTILSLKGELRERARFVLIVPNSLDADGFRRLRVWLLCRCNGRPAQPGIAAL